MAEYQPEPDVYGLADDDDVEEDWTKVIPPREEHIDTYYDDDAYGQSEVEDGGAE